MPSAYVREGPSIVDFGAWTTADARGDVAAKLAPHRNLLDAVAVDATGIGYNFAKHFKDLGYPVVEWNAGGEATRKETDSRGPGFRNAKGEAYWAMRDRLAKGEVNGLVDERTQGQLSTVKYKLNSRGQVEIESKDDARKRGVKSPDRAEALILGVQSGTMAVRDAGNVCLRCNMPLDDHQWFAVVRDGAGWGHEWIEIDPPKCPAAKHLTLH